MIIVTLTQSELDEPIIGASKLINHPFIHASTFELFHLITTKFVGKTNLFLVIIDESKLKSIVKYEDKNHNNLFYPHIYGTINKDAIVGIYPLVMQGDMFIPPAEIASNFNTHIKNSPSSLGSGMN